MASLVPSGRDDGCGRHARTARRPAVHRNHPRFIGATIRERGRDVRRAARCVALLTRSAVRSGRDDCRHRRAALSWRAPLRRRPLRQGSALHPDALRAASRRCQEVRRRALAARRLQLQRCELSLIGPCVRDRYKAVPHGIHSNVLPAFFVVFEPTQLPIPEVALPDRMI